VYPDRFAAARELPLDELEAGVLRLLSTRVQPPYRLEPARRPRVDTGRYAGMVRVRPRWRQHHFALPDTLEAYLDDARGVPTSLTLFVEVATHGRRPSREEFSVVARIPAPRSPNPYDVRGAQLQALDSLLTRLARSTPATAPGFRAPQPRR
jgi:hypothetical protein